MHLARAPSTRRSPLPLIHFWYSSARQDPTEGAQRVVIVANPQIPAKRNSYSGRNALSQFIVDLNQRKAWMAAKRKRPDALIFLGDMVHNWRADISQTECVSSLAHWCRQPTDRHILPGIKRL